MDSSLEMLLLQRSYYPLIPNNANEDIEKNDYIISTDLRKLKHPSMKMNIIPDIILTSSVMNTFAKKINGTLFINPGHIYKGSSLGSIAKIGIYPTNVKYFILFK